MKTPSQLLKIIPQNDDGGSPPAFHYWQSLRIQKVSVWDRLGGTVSLSFPGDTHVFSDVGVPGHKSASLHVVPPLMIRQTWYSGTDTTTNLFKVTSDTGAQITLYVTAEVSTTKISIV